MTYNLLKSSLFAEVQVNNHTNYDRLTSFLGCRREVLGSSSVLCLSFQLPGGGDEDEVDSPLGLMACLSIRGKIIPSFPYNAWPVKKVFPA